MLNILISFLTFVLILISLFIVLVVLMQRANTNAGMGSAFGGGVAESAFGTETTNILVRATKWSTLAFFILSLVLYLLYMNRQTAPRAVDTSLPDIPVAAAPAAPAATEATDATEAPVEAAPAPAEAPVDEAPAPSNP